MKVKCPICGCVAYYDRFYQNQWYVTNITDCERAVGRRWVECQRCGSKLYEKVKEWEAE